MLNIDVVDSILDYCKEFSSHQKGWTSISRGNFSVIFESLITEMFIFPDALCMHQNLIDSF